MRRTTRGILIQFKYATTSGTPTPPIAGCQRIDPWLAFDKISSIAVPWFYVPLWRWRQARLALWGTSWLPRSTIKKAQILHLCLSLSVVKLKFLITQGLLNTALMKRICSCSHSSLRVVSFWIAKRINTATRAVTAAIAQPTSHRQALFPHPIKELPSRCIQTTKN